MASGDNPPTGPVTLRRAELASPAMEMCGCGGMSESCPTCLGKGYRLPKDGSPPGRGRRVYGGGVQGPRTHGARIASAPTSKSSRTAPSRGRSQTPALPPKVRCPLCGERVESLPIHVRAAHAVTCPRCGKLTVDIPRHFRKAHAGTALPLPRQETVAKHGKPSKTVPKNRKLVRCASCGAFVKDLEKHRRKAHRSAGFERSRRLWRPGILGLHRPVLG